MEVWWTSMLTNATWYGLEEYETVIGKLMNKHPRNTQLHGFHYHMLKGGAKNFFLDKGTQFFSYCLLSLSL